MVGGGIVGLATADALLTRGARRVVVLEGEPTVASHQTGHNSGVIHAGLYYRPDSLKARTCTVGREALFAFCAEHGVATKRCGKLVVATRDAELPALDALAVRAVANGLAIERLDPVGIREREPAATGVAGLWVPETGVVDFRAVAAALVARIERRGGEVRCRTGVVGVRDDGHDLRVTVRRGRAREVIAADRLVGCAGLWSDRLARACGVDPGLAIVPFRGEYHRLRPEKASLVRGLIYPVPDPGFPFLGVHLTRRIDGTVEAGPNAVLAWARAGYRWRDVSPRDLLGTLGDRGFRRFARRHWRFGVTELARSRNRPLLARDLRRLVPALQSRDLVPAGSGVRAQAIDRDGNLVDDFRIVAGERSVHVVNAPSPAATAALAIGEHVARIVGEPAPECRRTRAGPLDDGTAGTGPAATEDDTASPV